MRRDQAATRERVVDAATHLFTTKGFRATTIRDIAQRARVNVASGHYHFGSKEALYLEVLREQFMTIRTTLAARGALFTPEARGKGSRRELETRFRNGIRAMLEMQVGAHALPHPTLMHREMLDPGDALPIVVREFVGPILAEMATIIRALAPKLPPRSVERCVLSVAGQAHFYFTIRPALLELWGWDDYPEGFLQEVAEHIAAFSLGGLRALTRPQKKTRGRRA